MKATLKGIKNKLRIIQNDEIMKKIIDLDNMSCIGYFREKDKQAVFNEYNHEYDFCEFDIDGDLTVSNDCDDY